MFVPRKGYHKIDISRIAKTACERKQAFRSGGLVLSAWNIIPHPGDFVKRQK